MRMNISDARIVEWSISAENGTVKATLVHNITVTGGLCLSFATYSVITGLLSLLMCLSVAMNAAVLATFLIHRRRLITPFTVHVVGLTIFGLIHSIVFFPLVAARPLEPPLDAEQRVEMCDLPVRHLDASHAKFYAGLYHLRGPMGGVSRTHLVSPGELRRVRAVGIGSLCFLAPCLVYAVECAQLLYTLDRAEWLWRDALSQVSDGSLCVGLCATTGRCLWLIPFPVFYACEQKKAT